MCMHVPYFSSPQCYNRPYLGTPLPISTSMRTTARGLQAVGSMKMATGFDTWFANRVERAKFLKSVSQVCSIPVEWAWTSAACTLGS